MASLSRPPAFSPTNLRQDVFSSLVVALVALPLSLGISIASGAPTVMAGIIACAVGGIVAGFIGGAPLQVSGPAAGLTLVVFSLIHTLGWELTCAATFAAGALQIVFGALRIGKVCLAISPAVVHGMLGGIGIVITLSQIHIVLGGSPESSALRNLLAIPEQLADLHGPATIVGLTTIGILTAWQYAPQRIKIVPGALVAVLLPTIGASLLGLDMPRVQIPGSLLSGLSLPTAPSAQQLGSFVMAAITIALVASTESLLCAVATDRLHSGIRARLNRELVGQGLSNLVSGLLGGLPVTGVVVRSSANIAAGAHSKYSAVLHGVWILLAVFFLRSQLEQIPLAALAGLLVFVGIQLVNPEHIREVKHHREGVIYFVTLFAVAFWDLLGGVMLGLGLSAFWLFWRLSRARVIVENANNRWHVLISGAVTFLSVPELSNALATIPEGTEVDVDLMVDFIDHAALDALHNWRTIHERTGGTVDIDETHEIQEESGGWSRVNVERIEQSGSTRRAITRLLNGVAHFNQSSSKSTAPMLAKLARKGQSPKTLFVGCSDSRLLTQLMTGTGPGELFKLRNVGNLIPPTNDISVGATIDFAVGVLGVDLIVVCGHSDCGAMKALLSASPPPSENLKQWLANAKDVVTEFNSATTPLISFAANTSTEHDRLAQWNAVQQIENLRRYPVVKEKEHSGHLELYAMYFDISAAKTYVYDAASNGFIEGDAFRILIRDSEAYHDGSDGGDESVLPS